MTDNLRAALEAAIPDLPEDQAHRARDLLAALPALPSLPASPMPEPEWPGAPVIAGCHQSMEPRLHIRRNWVCPDSMWECVYCIVAWSMLDQPRPLTPAEYAAHGIPQPCEHEKVTP